MASAEGEVFVGYEHLMQFNLTDLLTAPAHDYNSADVEQIDEANEHSQPKENANSLPADPVINTQGPRTRKPCIKKQGRVRTVGEGDDASLEWYHPRDQEWSRSRKCTHMTSL